MDATHLYLNIGTVAAIFVALLLATRNITASATRVQVATETMTTRLASVTAALEKLPLIEQRLVHMEDEQARLRQKVYSDHPKKHADLDSKLAVLAEKAASTDKFKAVRMGSNPDFGKEGE